MHLCSRYLPKPSANSPPDNRAPPMANTSQAPDLEGLHCEIHGMAEQMRIMNENNARLVQLLAAANPLPLAAPPIPDIERSHHSNLSGGRSQNLSTDRARRGRRRSPSPPRRERSSSSESSEVPAVGGEEMRRGRSPRIGDRIGARDKSTSQKIRDLDARLDAINTGTNAPVIVDTLIRQTEPPFTEKSKADKYIDAEELAEAKRRRRGKDDHKRKEPDTRRIDYREEARNKRPDRDSKHPNDRRPRTPPRHHEFILPPLNAPVAQALSEIKHEEFVKWPEKIKTDPQKRNRNKYYEFHCDHGHNTEDCFQLKEQIADLIKRERKGMPEVPIDRPKKKSITSPSSSVGDHPPITFSNDDLRGLHLPHDDALVVSAVIANFNVQRILIDNGSSADILFISAFERMKIGLDKTTNFGRSQGDHLNLSLEAEIPHLNRNRRDKGRSKDGQAMLHFGHEGLVIQTPSGEQMKYAIRIGFKATNNKAEYEALLAGLRVAVELGAQSLDVFSDSCIPLEFLASPSIDVANLVLQVGENPTLMDEIITYLQEGTLPRDKLQARRIQYRFGIPKVIISDNARQFDNNVFKIFCLDLAISHHFSSPGHPQANGQVEVSNRTILRNLKARLERSKSEWAEELPSILWAYHTTSWIPTGETPYSMVFGTESVILVEIGMPSFRTLNFDKESNEIELRLNLDLLDEKREMAELRQAAYKCQVAKYYNRRVKHRSFLLGDLVLQKVTLSTKEPSAEKLDPTWEGPYKVVKVSRPGTYWLEDLSKKALLHPWNAEHLKKYYQ
ncbi:hypothetical protein Acr_00g0077760 [Actinidia rufa]|uniref:Integrase catalytic domain-containing protein n=1 Tax=Actinidia rufa TaxID=165716 RepID=A0A7J0DTQ1_9ERIC|nr:hypothetical protein Acr_00g0077760 [Actinidia rufa]